MINPRNEEWIKHYITNVRQTNSSAMEIGTLNKMFAHTTKFIPDMNREDMMQAVAQLCNTQYQDNPDPYIGRLGSNVGYAGRLRAGLPDPKVVEFCAEDILPWIGYAVKRRKNTRKSVSKSVSKTASTPVSTPPAAPSDDDLYGWIKAASQANAKSITRTATGDITVVLS